MRAAKTNKKKWGRDFYKRIGALGGKKSTGGGFAASHQLASRAGQTGGSRSKKGYKLIKVTDKSLIYQHKETGERLMKRRKDA